MRTMSDLPQILKLQAIAMYFGAIAIEPFAFNRWDGVRLDPQQGPLSRPHQDDTTQTLALLNIILDHPDATAELSADDDTFPPSDSLLLAALGLKAMLLSENAPLSEIAKMVLTFYGMLITETISREECIFYQLS